MSSRIFLTAVELGVFEALGNNMLSATRLAEYLDVNASALRILLDALTGMGLLLKSDEKYSQKDEFISFFSPESGDNSSDIFGYAAYQWKVWSGLTEAVRNGRGGCSKQPDEARKGLAKTMQRQARNAADSLAGLLDGIRFKRVLDLGGGSGAYSLALARRFSNAEIVLFDSDEVALSIARDEIDRLSLGDRITVLHGDFRADSFGNDFDLVLISFVFSLLDPENARRLLYKINDSLKMGGRVLIHDMMLGDTKTGPLTAALFSVNMLVNTDGGRAYSRNEVTEMLKDCGYREIQHSALSHTQVALGSR